MSEHADVNFFHRCWSFLWRPSPRWPWLVFVVVGLVIGVAASGGTAGALWFTSTNAFCSSCHQGNVVPEWKKSFHYLNTAGFTAGCADCHEPRDPVGMVLRKMAAVDEVWNQLLGTISTPEKFAAHRLELAQKVWAELHANKSQACRNCHTVGQMNDPEKAALATMHQTVLANGQTCIDCHKGVAHQAPIESAAAGAKQ
jgi:nitrate/TMAO reductase-like tetraheme cytochrome c subunit